MGRVEVEDVSLQAHAVNEGVVDTMLEGSIKLDRNDDGIAVVLELRTVGKKTPMTAALRDLVMRSLRSRSLVVTHDGEEIQSETTNLLERTVAARKLRTLKRLPMGGPKLLKQGS